MADLSPAPTASRRLRATSTTAAIAAASANLALPTRRSGGPVPEHESPEKQTPTTARVTTKLGGSNRLIGVRETAARLDVPVSTLYKHWREWQLTAYRVGRALKFRERDIEVWLERQRVDGVV